MSPIYLSQNLRFLRKAFHFPQWQVALWLNVERSSYTYYETGRTLPPLQICHLFLSIFFNSNYKLELKKRQLYVNNFHNIRLGYKKFHGRYKSPWNFIHQDCEESSSFKFSKAIRTASMTNAEKVHSFPRIASSTSSIISFGKRIDFNVV